MAFLSGAHDDPRVCREVEGVKSWETCRDSSNEVPSQKGQEVLRSCQRFPSKVYLETTYYLRIVGKNNKT